MKSQEILDKLNWRYATKGFDSSLKLTEEQLESLLSVIQLAPSSYGLQPYTVFVVADEEVKQKLRAAAYNQPQVTDASEILVFATYQNFTLAHVDAYASNIAKTRGIEKTAIQGFVDVMNGIVTSRSAEELKNWNAKQAYIALGVLLETAALLNIDACPMEGFDAAQFDEILGIKDKNLSTLAMVAVGHRSESDKYQELKKVRKSKEELFIKI
jgi:nitroreductase